MVLLTFQRIFDLLIKLHDTHHSFHDKTAHVSQSMIGRKLSCTRIMMHHSVWLAESFHEPALWYHDRGVSLQNMVPMSIFQAQLGFFTEEISTSKGNVNVMESMSV